MELPRDPHDPSAKLPLVRLCPLSLSTSTFPPSTCYADSRKHCGKARSRRHRNQSALRLLVAHAPTRVSSCVPCGQLWRVGENQPTGYYRNAIQDESLWRTALRNIARPVTSRVLPRIQEVCAPFNHMPACPLLNGLARPQTFPQLSWESA